MLPQSAPAESIDSSWTLGSIGFEEWAPWAVFVKDLFVVVLTPCETSNVAQGNIWMLGNTIPSRDSPSWRPWVSQTRVPRVPKAADPKPGIRDPHLSSWVDTLYTFWVILPTTKLKVYTFWDHIPTIKLKVYTFGDNITHYKSKSVDFWGAYEVSN